MIYTGYMHGINDTYTGKDSFHHAVRLHSDPFQTAVQTVCRAVQDEQSWERHERENVGFEVRSGRSSLQGRHRNVLIGGPRLSPPYRVPAPGPGRTLQ
jgi:hypothetical protein